MKRYQLPYLVRRCFFIQYFAFAAIPTSVSPDIDFFQLLLGFCTDTMFHTSWNSPNEKIPTPVSFKKVLFHPICCFCGNTNFCISWYWLISVIIELLWRYQLPYHLKLSKWKDTSSHILRDQIFTINWYDTKSLLNSPKKFKRKLRALHEATYISNQDLANQRDLFLFFILYSLYYWR